MNLGSSPRASRGESQANSEPQKKVIHQGGKRKGRKEVINDNKSEQWGRSKKRKTTLTNCPRGGEKEKKKPKEGYQNTDCVFVRFYLEGNLKL